MAGIYIPGMKMPQYYGDYDATFSVMPDGKVTVVWACKFCPTLDEFCGEVIPVPDHGDLIDRDEQFKRLQKLNLSDAGMRLIETVLSTSDAVLTADKI